MAITRPKSKERSNTFEDYNESQVDTLLEVHVMI